MIRRVLVMTVAAGLAIDVRLKRLRPRGRPIILVKLADNQRSTRCFAAVRALPMFAAAAAEDNAV